MIWWEAIKLACWDAMTITFWEALKLAWMESQVSQSALRRATTRLYSETAIAYCISALLQAMLACGIADIDPNLECAKVFYLAECYLGMTMVLAGPCTSSTVPEEERVCGRGVGRVGGLKPSTRTQQKVCQLLKAEFQRLMMLE